MPTGPAPLVAQKKCGPPSGIGKQEVTQLLEPNFPDHHHHQHASKQDAKWSKHSRAQAQQQQQQQQQEQPNTRNIYTWISAPRAIYNNKRLMRMSNDRKGSAGQQCGSDGWLQLGCWDPEMAGFRLQSISFVRKPWRCPRLYFSRRFC
uniref:Uncharacterized protein n=1 Tax=Anopheles melas TaxID=34690 RepID=A0A182UB02_9DIPT